MICPSCGREDGDTTMFCRGCGQSLNSQVFSDARKYLGIGPEAMKQHVIKAFKMTHESGMTNRTFFQKLEFKNDAMGIAIGSKAVGVGGMGGRVTVTPEDGGCRVGVVWEGDSAKCREVTGFFWNNLDAVTAPRSAKSVSMSTVFGWIGFGIGMFVLLVFIPPSDIGIVNWIVGAVVGGISGGVGSFVGGLIDKN